MASALTETPVLPETPSDDIEFDLDLRIEGVARHLSTDPAVAMMPTGRSYNAPGCASCDPALQACG
jgi:hypothetical protein